MKGFGFVSALAFACAGWAVLSLGMDRYYADIHGRGKAPDRAMRRCSRTIGAFALLASFVVAVGLEGWTVGAVLCLGTMTAGAMLLVLLLTYAPQRVAVVAKAAGLLALLFGWAWFAT